MPKELAHLGSMENLHKSLAKQMKTLQLDCQRDAGWFTSSSESDSSPEPKRVVSRKRDTTQHRLTPEYLDQVIPVVNRILRRRQPEGTNERHFDWQDTRWVIEQVNRSIQHKEAQ